MKIKVFDPPKFISEGPFLLSEVTETPEGNLVAKLLESEHQAMMERAIMCIRTEFGFKLARKNGTERRMEPFSYEYLPEKLSFIIKPIGVKLDAIKEDMRYFIPPNVPGNKNSPTNS